MRITVGALISDVARGVNALSAEVGRRVVDSRAVGNKPCLKRRSVDGQRFYRRTRGTLGLGRVIEDAVRLFLAAVARERQNVSGFGIDADKRRAGLDKAFIHGGEIALVGEELFNSLLHIGIHGKHDLKSARIDEHGRDFF